jgi:uncharacterized protein
MKQYVLFKSKKGNRYVFDRKKKKTILCHPVLYYLLELEDSGRDLKKWILELNGALDIEGVGRITIGEIKYYYRKYQILKQNGHFETSNQEERLSSWLSPDSVKDLLANVSQVTFETTENCCLKCLYCGYGEFYIPQENRAEKAMEFSTVKNVIRYLLDYWNSPMNRSHGQNIYIGFYGGEPLLNFKLIEEVVNFMKNLNLQHNVVTFSITTNGILLDKYMDFLVENEFNLLISLDGGESNNSYRVFKNGKPAFMSIKKNVEALQSKYPDYFTRKVNFNAVIHNKNSISEVYNYFKQNFDKIPRVGGLDSFGIREDQKEAFWKAYSNLNESLYKNEDYSLIQREMFIRLPNIQYVSDFIHINNDFCFNNYNEMLYSLDNTGKLPTGTCLPFSRKIFVTANGKILQCERINHEYALGTVDENGVNIDFEDIAVKYSNWFGKIISQCDACYQSENCVQCIFYLDLSSDHTICNGFMNLEDYSKYLSSHIDFLENTPSMYSEILKKVVIK